MSKLIIFDFDGTIADSYDLIYKSLCEYSKLTPNKDEIRKLSTSKVTSLFNLSKFDLIRMIFKVRRDFKECIPYLSCFNGIKESLIKMKSNSNKLVLLTSNSEENVNIFLNRNGLSNIFDDICSVSTIYGKSRILARIKKKYSKQNNDVYYIADETRDIIAAKKAGISTSCEASP